MSVTCINCQHFKPAFRRDGTVNELFRGECEKAWSAVGRLPSWAPLPTPLFVSADDGADCASLDPIRWWRAA